MDKVLGLSNYISNIDSNDKLRYSLVLIGSLFFSVYMLNGDTKHLLGLLIGVSLILFLNDKKISDKSDINRDLELKLHLLDKDTPLYFHLDPNIINLFFSIKDFKTHNPKAFIQAMKTTDNVLHLKSDMENNLENPVQTFQIAQMMASRSLNHMQSFIFSIPKSSVFKNKYQQVLDRHHILLKRNLDFMFNRCKELTTDINNSTIFITDYNMQQPYNPLIFKMGESNFELFN